MVVFKIQHLDPVCVPSVEKDAFSELSDKVLEEINNHEVHVVAIITPAKGKEARISYNHTSIEVYFDRMCSRLENSSPASQTT